MSDLSSLTTDQLTARIRDKLGGLSWRNPAHAYLAELQTRANQRDGEILRVQQMHYAAEEQHVAVVKAVVEAWKARALAVEKERDEALRVGRAQRLYAAERRAEAAEARLAETVKALERIVAAADADAALNLRDVAFIARAALTTHHTGEAVTITNISGIPEDSVRLVQAPGGQTVERKRRKKQ